MRRWEAIGVLFQQAGHMDQLAQLAIAVSLEAVESACLKIDSSKGVFDAYDR